MQSNGGCRRVAEGEVRTFVAEPNTPAVESERDSSPSRRVRFLRDVSLFGSANVVYLLVSGILTFVLPRLLSIDTYGYYRLFILYSGFAGLLHFGYADGLLVRWAANPDCVLDDEVPSSLVLLTVLLLVVLIPSSFLAVLLLGRQWLGLIVAIAVYTFFYHWSILAVNAVQARKQFGLLSVYIIASPALFLLVVLVAGLGWHVDLWLVLGAYVASYALAALWLWTRLFDLIRWYVPTISEIKKLAVLNISIGWPILIANTLSSFTLVLDRLFVSAGFSIRQFAIYSFAGNVLGIIYTLIVSVSQVVFPYISEGVSNAERARAYFLAEELILVLWAAFLASYFPLVAVIHWWLPAFAASVPVLQWLIIPTGLSASIYVLHGTYFRMALQQKRFLVGAVFAIMCALILLSLARLSGSMQLVAGAMVIVIAMWWIVNEILLRSIVEQTVRAVLRRLLIVIVCASLFLWSAISFSLILGCVVYVGGAAIVVFLACRHGLSSVMGIIRIYRRRRLLNARL